MLHRGVSQRHSTVGLRRPHPSRLGAWKAFSAGAQPLITSTVGGGYKDLEGHHSLEKGAGYATLVVCLFTWLVLVVVGDRFGAVMGRG